MTEQPAEETKAVNPLEETKHQSNPVHVYSDTVHGVFSYRLNRFTAVVFVDGKPETVHVKNTGRLTDLLLPEAEVTLQKSANPERKTRYDLISVYSPELKWVNIDSQVPNILVRQELLHSKRNRIVIPEYRYGNSRLDFYMETETRRVLREVKGCTLSAGPGTGIGLFPDAPTERGVRHLSELEKAVREGLDGQVDFVAQMNGVCTVLPNCNEQMEFARAMIHAARAGVQILCHSCEVIDNSIRLTGVSEETGIIAAMEPG